MRWPRSLALALAVCRTPVRLRGARSAALGAVLACTAFVAAAADMKPFAGTWVIRASTVAPWADSRFPPDAAEPRRLIGKEVAFGKARVSGPPPLGCAKPVYAVSVVPADMIFEGGLAGPPQAAVPPDFAAAAQRLGFADPEHIATLDAGCTEVQFHEVVPGTLAFRLNNRVYTMTRK